jgi:uncharacterized protein
MMLNTIEIRRIPGKGRGVFALRNFSVGDIIESAPAMAFTPKERKLLEKTAMNSYIYPWRSTRSAAVVFGYGSIYNHSYDPNADWKQNFKTTSMIYRAVKPIKAGDEITVNYNGEPDDMTPIHWEDWVDGSKS